MDMDGSVEMLMLNQKLKLMLIMAMVVMEVTVDMDTAASADLLLLKPLQLHIMDMADTEDMVDTDMAVNDVLLSPTMDTEATGDMDTDTDVKLLLVNSKEKQLNPTPKDQSNEEFSSTPNNLFTSKKENKKGDF